MVEAASLYDLPLERIWSMTIILRHSAN
jgi:hypothetical protein